jgi:hypothetical protein
MWPRKVCGRQRFVVHFASHHTGAVGPTAQRNRTLTCIERQARTLRCLNAAMTPTTSPMIEPDAAIRARFAPAFEDRCALAFDALLRQPRWCPC